MKKIITCICLFLSVQAYAHIKMGTYQGKSLKGKTCTISFLEKKFRSQVHHPLNEVVTTSVHSKIYELQHPSSYNVQSTTITFNHDKLTGFRGNDKEIEYLEIALNHSGSNKGPKEFLWVSQKTNKKRKDILNCKGLRFLQLGQR